PKVDRTRDELLALEWVPFKKTLPMLDLLMVGHVSYPKVDPSGLPASLSRQVVHQTLREVWNYTGCTITDDMDMGAIKTKYGSADAAVQALEAGNDLMLVCHSVQAVPEIASALCKANPKALEESYNRILELRKRLKPAAPFSLDAFKSLDAQTAQLREQVL